MPTITVTNNTGGTLSLPVTGSHFKGLPVSGSYLAGASKSGLVSFETYSEFLSGMAAGVLAGSWSIVETAAAWPTLVQSEHTVAGPIVTAVPATGGMVGVDGDHLIDAEIVTIDDGTNPATVLEFDSGGGVVGGHVAVAFVPHAHAIGTIDCTTGALTVDGEIFILHDGTHPWVAYEFDLGGGGVGGGHTAIVYAGAETAGQMRDLIITAVHAQFLANASTIDAAIGAAAQVALTNTNPGVVGNQFTFENVVDAGFVLSNMAGGLECTTAAVVRDNLVAAINGVVAGLLIMAAPGGGATLTLLADVGGVTNVAITTTVVDAGFLAGLTGMGGGIDADTAGQMRDACIVAINGVVAGLAMLAAPGGADEVLLTNDVGGAMGNVPITTTHGGGLGEVGMLNGVDATTAAAVRTALVAAINDVVAGLLVTAAPGAGATLTLVNDVVGVVGNVAITTDVADATFLAGLSGMSGGLDNEVFTVTAPLNVIGRGYTPLLVDIVTVSAGAVGARTQTVQCLGDAGDVGVFLDAYREGTGQLFLTNCTGGDISAARVYVSWGRITV